MSNPHFGFTKHGLPIHLHAHEHLPDGTRYQRFNKALALKVTAGVGSMTCAYIFCVISLLGLPQALQQTFSGGFHPLPLVQWVAQTFLQLVLLSVIIVGQNVGAEASDVRAAKTFEDAEETKVAVATALDRLDIRTEGGIKEVLDAVTSLRAELAARPKHRM